MTSKTTRLLQSDYLNKNNYKSIESTTDLTPGNDISMAPITGDKKDLFNIDGKISHIDSEMVVNNRSSIDNEDNGQCYKIFCGGLNMIIFTGIGLCLLILLIMLIVSN
jgi:hypothetical protein